MTNRLKPNTLFFTLLLLFFQAGFCFGQSPQYENKVIESINVEVSTPTTSDFDANSIKARLKIRQGEHFTQTEFDNELKNLARDFDRVLPEIAIVDDKIHITLKIWLKPTIRMIYWTGNTKIKRAVLQKELGIGLCSIFDRQSFNKAFHKLKAHYIKEGFFEAQLEYSTTPDPFTNEVDIEIRIIEGRAGRIKDIVFCGFTATEKDELLEMMVTKEYYFLTSWLTNEGTYSEDAIQQDQFVILNYLQNKGYADAQVDIKVCEAKENNRIIIYVIANKGPVYRLGEITFEGNTLFSDDEIYKQLTIGCNAVYSPETIRETVEAVTNLYGRFGYIDANVNYEPQLACDECVYSIHLTIEEGEQFCVGLIKVFGNCVTETRIILHEALVVPGQVFNAEKLKKTEERLQNVGFFKNVNVYAVKSDESSCLGGNYRDVHIEVEETSTGHFNASVGFSTVESLFGSIGVTETNFNYKGIPRLFKDGYQALRGGGEYAHVTATVGKKSRSYNLSWTQPYFRDTQWSVGFELENSSARYISKDYDIKSTGITFHGDYQINPFVRYGLHHRFAYTTAHISGHALTKENAKSRRNEIAAGKGGWISAFGVNLGYDSTDHPLRPRKGIKSKIETEYGGVGGNYHFYSFAYLNNVYFPVGREGVIRLRGDMRFITPICQTTRRTLPLDERLFLGGDSVVRGYRAYKLGPRFENGDPEGGYSLQFLSLEYSRRLLKRLDGFVFFDAGHLSYKTGNFGRLSTAVGFGVRFQIFESGPPLMMGIGFPLNARKRSEVKQFFLQVGGQF